MNFLAMMGNSQKPGSPLYKNLIGTLSLVSSVQCLVPVGFHLLAPDILWAVPGTATSSNYDGPLTTQILKRQRKKDRKFGASLG